MYFSSLVHEGTMQGNSLPFARLHVFRCVLEHTNVRHRLDAGYVGPGQPRPDPGETQYRRLYAASDWLSSRTIIDGNMTMATLPTPHPRNGPSHRIQTDQDSSPAYPSTLSCPIRKGRGHLLRPTLISSLAHRTWLSCETLAGREKFQPPLLPYIPR